MTTGNQDAALLDCDLILGCTDRHTPRAYLNDLAVRYGIPYTDVGTRATAANGLVHDLLAEARHVVQGGPCLWCLDVLDRRTIRQENLPPELVEQEVRDGYLRGDDPEPSTILMTTMAATMGTTQAIAYLLNQANVWDEQVIFNLWSCELHRNSPARDTECRCQHGLESPDIPLLSSLSL